MQIRSIFSLSLVHIIPCTRFVFLGTILRESSNQDLGYGRVCMSILGSLWVVRIPPTVLSLHGCLHYCSFSCVCNALTTSLSDGCPADPCNHECRRKQVMKFDGWIYLLIKRFGPHCTLVTFKCDLQTNGDIILSLAFGFYVCALK